MLRRYRLGDRPSFVVTLHGADGFKRDFSVHRSVMEKSFTFHRALRDRDSGGGVCRKRARDDALVPILDVHTSWFRTYDQLCRNDPLPFEWMLMHLYAYADIEEVADDCCPAGELLATEDEPPMCTEIVGEPVAHQLVVLLELLDWFKCPPALAVHVLTTLLRTVAYSDTTHHLLPLLRPLVPAESLALVDMLAAATESMMWTLAPSVVPYLTLPPRMGHGADELASRMQTLGAAHRAWSVVENYDVASFLDGFTCRLTMGNVPLVAYLDTNTDYLCGGGSCICTHTTETIMYPKRANGVYDFAFGCLRDLRTVDFLYRDGTTETIALLTRGFSLTINWYLDESSNCMCVNVVTVYSGAGGTPPVLSLEMGVLNVFDSTTLELYDDGIDGSICIPSDATMPEPPYSNVLALTDNADQYHGIEQRTRRHFVCRRTWKVDFGMLRAGEGERYQYDNNEYDEYVRPPRLFMFRGSVQFDNPKITNEE